MMRLMRVPQALLERQLQLQLQLHSYGPLSSHEPQTARTQHSKALHVRSLKL